MTLNASATDREALRRRNLEAFRAFAPAIADALAAFKPAAQLKFAADGQPDVELGGQTLYGGQIDAVVQEQVQRFLSAPTRLGFRPEWAVTCLAHADPFATRLMNRAKEMKLDFPGATIGIESPMLAVFGIGLGRHLPPLIEATSCRHLHLFDTSHEFLALSLETFDWSELFAALAARGGGVSFLVSSDAETISATLAKWMRHTLPMAVDGTGLFLHSEHPNLIAGIRGLSAHFRTMLLDLGFFYDESLMLRNAVINLQSGRERLYRRGDAKIDDLPAFVIGTGPSLDNEFAFLRENRDKAVIVSAGTALRSLLLNGVVPDIQIETENIDVEPVVAETNRQRPVRDIPLVASVTTDPAAVALFDDVRYFHRLPLTPTQVFCDDDSNSLIDANITVGNGALAFAQEMGFRDIYLFGLDMSTRTPAEHHSKDSYHYTDGAIVYEPDLLFDIERPANFGGVSYTSLGLSVALRHIERSIARYGRERRHFNCADGCAFNSAQPTRSADLKLPAPAPGRKDAVLAGLYDRFPEMPAGQYRARWDFAAARQAGRDALAGMRAVAAGGAGALLDKGYMGRLMAAVGQPAGRPPVPFRNLYGGSVLQMFVVAEYFLRRVADPKRLTEFEAVVREELLAAFDGLDRATDALFEDIAANVSDGA